MSFDTLVAAVVPPALLADVQGILIGMNFVDTLASQAWDRLVVGASSGWSSSSVVGLFQNCFGTPNDLTVTEIGECHF